MTASSYNRDDGWVQALSGVIVATCTPFREDGGLDLDRVKPYVDFLVSRRVAGLMVGGTTSEFIAMSVQERLKLISAAVAATQSRVPVIAHVGHVVLSEGLRMAEAAATAGAQALAVIVPYFHAYSQAAIVAHLRAFARAVPELPIFVYNYPAATGNRLSADGFAELLDEPNVAGTKLSMETMDEIEPFLRFLPQVCVVSGNDTLWRSFTTKGGRVVVSGNAAAVPELMVSTLAAYLAGDDGQAAALEPLLYEVVRLSAGGAPPLLKHLLQTRGMGIGPARIRSVLVPSKNGGSPSHALREAVHWEVVPA